MLIYNPQAKVNVVHIGMEQCPLVLIDDFVKCPEHLIELAQRDEAFCSAAKDYYPGVRKTLPQNYADLVRGWINTYLPDATQLAIPGQASVILCAFSVANQDPNSLLPVQCIPHFDTFQNGQWAMVHYLCDESFGGTGFFRHKTSGFERISPERHKRYLRLLNDEARKLAMPTPGYLQGSSALFDMTYQVPAKFNRAILYPSNLLHSGLIKKWHCETPTTGRLTANTFCHFD